MQNAILRLRDRKYIGGVTDTEPAWKQRALERSLQPAKLRAAQRVQRFLEAAQSIMAEKGSTDFTVQEVVDQSRQSLRSFYLQFDGKPDGPLPFVQDQETGRLSYHAEGKASFQGLQLNLNLSLPLNRLLKVNQLFQ